MSEFTQSNRPISISTPLGDDALLLKSFNYHEELCRPFHAELELQSTDAAIDFSQIVGKAVTITINLPNYQKRYINGYISRFRQVGFTEELTDYRAELVPWIWMLSRSSTCRISRTRPRSRFFSRSSASTGLQQLSTT